LKRIQDKKLKNFIDQLRKRFGRNLKKIILFGSRARGDHSNESDYDLLLIFEKVTPEMKKYVDEIEDEMLFSQGALFSTFLFTPEELEEREFEPFIMNATKEGLVYE
jgi:predicted nucleotidyltransferase